MSSLFALFISTGNSVMLVGKVNVGVLGGGTVDRSLTLFWLGLVQANGYIFAIDLVNVCK